MHLRIVFDTDTEIKQPTIVALAEVKYCLWNPIVKSEENQHTLLPLFTLGFL